MRKTKDWRAEHLVFLRALQKPSELQRRLLELHGVDVRNLGQEAELEAIWSAERHRYRAEQAEITAKRVRQKLDSVVRRQRTRRLIELGGLVEIANMGGDRGVLLGGLLHLEKQLAKTDGEVLAGQFKTVGDAVLHRREVTSRALQKIPGLQSLEDDDSDQNPSKKAG